MSGWRRIVPVDKQGASTNTASKRVSGCHSVASGLDNFRRELKADQVVLQPIDPFWVDLNCRDMGAGGCQLGSLPARCGAEICHVFSCDVPKSFAGKGAAAASCTHHAPSQKPGRFSTRLRHEADRAGRQEHAAQLAISLQHLISR